MNLKSKYKIQILIITDIYIAIFSQAFDKYYMTTYTQE